MDRIDDERIQFYLRHEDQIDEWADVRADARQLAHRFYLSLEDDLAATAVELGGDVVARSDDLPWGRASLFRESWTDGAGSPIVVVALEWRREDTGFRHGWRVVGVRCERDTAAQRRLRDEIAELAVGPARAGGYRQDKRYWPVQRPVSGAGGNSYWTDLGPLRQALVDQVVEAFETFAGVIDDALARHHPEG
jgi:hypothetical protein